MLILVINCGSSSAKYQLFDMRKDKPLAGGVVERIGQAGASLSHRSEAKGAFTPLEKAIGSNRRHSLTGFTKKVSCNDHHAAITIIVEALTQGRCGVIKSRDDIGGIGHRVVHGGEEFEESTLLTDKVVASIRKYSELAPLHNPPALSGIDASSAILKGIPQVAVFDTSFHQTMPEEAFLYGLPLKYYKKYGVRRYGFHGTSHRFVSEEASRVLKRPLGRLKLVTCHLGNGCSMAAVSGGRSIDTSMGFTPLEGLLMGTRSGDLDPAAVLYILEKERLTLARVNDILNKESGLLGVSGVSNDMRDILRNARRKTPNHSLRSGSGQAQYAIRCRLAIEMFIYRIKKYIGAYQAAMGGLDAVIFTAGIGEHNPWIARRLSKELKGVVPAKTKFLVIPTNEELLIARDTYNIIRKGKNAESKT